MKRAITSWIACLLLICWSAGLAAQENLELSRLDLLFSGEGIEQRVRFGDDKGSHNVWVHDAYQIGSQGILLVGTDEAQPDRIPLYFLQRPATDLQQRWRGRPLCANPSGTLPEYWVLRPILAQARNDTTLLVLELADEESIGLLFLWWHHDETFLERFVPLTARDPETAYRIAPQLQCRWRTDRVDLAATDPMVRLDIGQQRTYLPGSWWQLAVTPLNLQVDTRPQGLQPLAFGGIQYAAVHDGLVLLHDGQRVLRPKQMAQAAKTIADQLGLATFDLIKGQGGVSAYYLHTDEPETYEAAWQQHWLGRWEAGKWTPAPRPK